MEANQHQGCGDQHPESLHRWELSIIERVLLHQITQPKGRTNAMDNYRHRDQHKRSQYKYQHFIWVSGEAILGIL
jgi:hypothetical protein